MSTPTEEGAAAAQPQADIEALIMQFQEQLAIQAQFFEENTPQQEKLKEVSANAHKIPYAQLAYMMYEVNAHGMIPPEVFDFECEQQETFAAGMSAQDCDFCLQEAYYMDYMESDSYEASSGENASGETASNFCQQCLYYEMQGKKNTSDNNGEEEDNGYPTTEKMI